MTFSSDLCAFSVSAVSQNGSEGVILGEMPRTRGTFCAGTQQLSASASGSALSGTVSVTRSRCARGSLPPLCRGLAPDLGFELSAQRAVSWK